MRSATTTLNLVVAGSAAVGAAALHSIPVLALGAVAYAALVAWDIASPAFWKKALSPGRPTLPEPGDLTDQALREVVVSLSAGREKLESVLSETPEDAKRHLGGVMGSVTQMEDGSVRLVQRAEELTRYLAGANPDPVRKEIESLRRKASSARDAATRREYESACSMREEQLRALDDIAAARDRVMANLARTVATLEGLSPKIVRMRALDAQAMDALSGTMNEELERINGDMQSFEETLKSVGESVHT